jgi:hypothetical protein
VLIKEVYAVYGIHARGKGFLPDCLPALVFLNIDAVLALLEQEMQFFGDRRRFNRCYHHYRRGGLFLSPKT